MDSLSLNVQYFFPASLYISAHNLIYCNLLFDIFAYVNCQVLGLLPISSDNIMSIASLEIYLIGKLMTCSILLSPTVRIFVSNALMHMQCIFRLSFKETCNSKKLVFMLDFIAEGFIVIGQREKISPLGF